MKKHIVKKYTEDIIDSIMTVESKDLKSIVQMQLDEMEQEISNLDKEWCNNKTMNLKIENLEFRLAKPLNSNNKYFEIVQWNDNDTNCWTIAMFHKIKDDVDIKLLSDRPFDNRIDRDIFCDILKYGYQLANAYFTIQDL